jgi:hypothetical protein
VLKKSDSDASIVANAFTVALDRVASAVNPNSSEIAQIILNKNPTENEALSKK